MKQELMSSFEGQAFKTANPDNSNVITEMLAELDGMSNQWKTAGIKLPEGEMSFFVSDVQSVEGANNKLSFEVKFLGTGQNPLEKPVEFFTLPSLPKGEEITSDRRLEAYVGPKEPQQEQGYTPLKYSYGRLKIVLSNHAKDHLLKEEEVKLVADSLVPSKKLLSSVEHG